MQIDAFTQRQRRLLPAKRYVRVLLLTACVSLPATWAHAQGCVAAHGSGLPCATSAAEGDQAHGWDVSVSYRWFTSDRHYVGTVEQKQREAAGDQVINRSNFVDTTLNYTFSPRYSLALTLPYVDHDRSQVVKNASGVILERFSTQSSGIGDIHVDGNAWVFNPATSQKGNLQLGLGLVLPTGKDDVVDVFPTFDKISGQILAVTKTVDQSIQPGTGGYGITLNLYGYRQLGGGFTGFVNGSYTITPEETNGVPTYRSNVYEAIMSIADTYFGRAGVEYAVPTLKGLDLSLALRIEGVPVRDLVGGSNGFRRPGYSVAVEPGISYTHNRWSARVYVPVAVKRNRLQSVPDKQRTAATGVYSQGDAAFADYLLLFNLSYKL